MRAHFNGFKALVEAQPKLSGRVYSTIRQTSGTPVRDNYVVVMADVPDLQDDRYTVRQARNAKAVYRYDVRVVAVDADGLLMLSDAVLDLIGQTPTVTGRRCDPVSMAAGVEEGKSRFDITTDLYFIDMTFELTSRRA